MASHRPNPDELLRRVQDEEDRAKRGRLTIFFGAAPGVGKTYAMLEAARTEKALERDLLVGVVETHNRYDTAALLLGLEILPRRKVLHRGVQLEEFDLEAALARTPGLVLVDELAHTNAPGSRHPKRWQDVKELLDAGIDVYTTLNVQHVESLVDVVAQITGVVVRETVPDSMLDDAHDVRLIDLPPDELLERLAAGQVYVPDQAARAIESFFRKGNLIALRELALRRTAERVDAQMDVYRRAEGIERAWPVAERILVCVSPSPASARLLRTSKRMARRLHAPWIAAFVETPASLRMSSADRERVAHHLRLAEELGAETVSLSASDAADEVVRYARARNVTRIVLGKPTHPRYLDLLRPSFLEEVVRKSREIEIHVTTGEAHEPEAVAARPEPSKRAPLGIVAAFVAVGLATAAAFPLFGRAWLADVVMTYMLAILVVAMRFGYRASIVATVLSILTFDFLFVPPYYSFAVTDLRHVVTFGVMLFVALVVSNLTQRTRDQAEAARGRELRTALLYALSRELAATQEMPRLVSTALSHLHDAFDAAVLILLPDAAGVLRVAPGVEQAFDVEGSDVGVVDWVWSNQRPAGPSTDTLPSASALFLPLLGSRGRVGVLGVRPREVAWLLDPDRRRLLDAFAAQLASALERGRLAEEAHRSVVQMEAERLRSSLLSSVSHDLRTPLGVITGAASSLLSRETALTDVARRELIETIREEADRLHRLVRNLLDMTRVASGALKVQREWHPVDELVGVSLARLDDRLGARNVEVRIPDGLPPVAVDAVLIEQVLVNLLENAVRYTPDGSPLEISACIAKDELVVAIADRGAGVPEQERERIFEKFYRLNPRRDGGAGLGLAICKGITEAHGGRIWVDDREGGGAVFRVVLPLEPPPTIQTE